VGTSIGDVDRSNRDVTKLRRLEEVLQRFWFAEREPTALIERLCFRVERDGRVPEEPHQLHAFGVVPDVRRHGSAGPDARHECGDRLRRKGKKVHD